jgi:hypothetical protein
MTSSVPESSPFPRRRRGLGASASPAGSSAAAGFSAPLRGGRLLGGALVLCPLPSALCLPWRLLGLRLLLLGLLALFLAFLVDHESSMGSGFWAACGWSGPA